MSRSTLMPEAIHILFLFAIGACAGSFLNVVIWRLPRGESLVRPASHCPRCGRTLRWYDNIPVLGWIMLLGRCRYCGQAISARYPIVEAVTGGLFVFYYVMFYIVGAAPCTPGGWEARVGPPIQLTGEPLSMAQTWPIYGLYMFMIAGLLASSMIDADHFIIPVEIPWLIAAVGIIVHAIVDRPTLSGALIVTAPAGAMALGGAVGLAISILLWWRGMLPESFPRGEPMIDIDREALAREIDQARREGREVAPLPPEYTRAQVRAEMRKEMMFLMPPMLLSAGLWALVTHVPTTASLWNRAMEFDWLNGMLGAILGALVGGFVVWIVRISGTFAFGRLAMGLGDVHLMFGIGAVIGAGAVVVAFFIAPFFGIALALYLLLTGKKRELPYGPYLSMATAFVLISYCSIMAWLGPGLVVLRTMMQNVTGI